MRSLLYRAHDLERLAARVSTRRAAPREVAALARTLDLLPEATDLLGAQGGLLGGVRERLSALPDVVTRIRAALVDEPPIRVGDGGLIRDGFHAELDELRAAAIGHRAWLADLEVTERQRTGIGSLKVGYNSVFGYYLEVTGAHLGKVPADYRQVATLKDRARFTRPDLREREREIARLEAAASRLEQEVFTELRDSLAAHAEALADAAGALSELDVLAALADVAAEHGWIRPVTSDGPCGWCRRGTRSWNAAWAGGSCRTTCTSTHPARGAADRAEYGGQEHVPAYRRPVRAAAPDRLVRPRRPRRTPRVRRRAHPHRRQ